MKRSRILAALSLVLFLAACGGGAAEETPEAGATADAPAASSRAAASDAPPDANAIDAALAEEEAAERDAAREYQVRRAAMASFEQCMRQAEGIEEPMRSTIEQACRRLPDAPQ